ncbi:MAG: hypothetical protein M0R77_00550 [Gammaproteobacteria bacterium]|nr:hypothetical protein [Acholeplasmataceae bacterium]MCK9529043.1 hypothetical protein [Gammaproteobacteria bacterium]
MFNWLRSKIKTKRKKIIIDEVHDKEIDVYTKTLVLFELLGKEHFRIFYTQHFLFDLYLPNAKELVKLLRELNRTVENKRPINENRLSFPLNNFDNDSFFYQDESYLNKFNYLEAIKKEVIKLITNVQTYQSSDEDLILPTKEYYERNLYSVISDLQSFAELIIRRV